MHHCPYIIRTCAFLIALFVCTLTAFGWHDEGHYYSALAAVRVLPDDMPSFFREGAGTIGHCSIDPDAFKIRELPQLDHGEYPEHFIDIDLLQGRELPLLRHDYLKMCYDMEVDPMQAGLLPYAISEWTQKLTTAFAEYRRNPDNVHIRAKCLVYAGILAHYAADLQMPLHTTIDWDGRYEPGKPYVRTGIHNRVDALPTKIPYNVLFAEPLPTPIASHDIFSFVLDELTKSRALVDRVYEMEEYYPAWDDLNLANDEVRAFAIERMRAAASFTADLYLSAWRNSANIQLPFWLDRKVFDGNFDPNIIPPQPKRWP